MEKKPFDIAKFYGVNNRRQATQMAVQLPDGSNAAYLFGADNVDLNAQGYLKRRKGFTSEVAANTAHSIWSDGEEGFCVLDGALTHLKQAGAGLSASTLALGFSSHLPVSFCRLPDGDVAYSSAASIGRISNGLVHRLAPAIPSATPMLSVGAGALTAGLYLVAFTLFNGDGESGATQVQQITVPANGAIQIAGGAGLRCYVSGPNGDILGYAGTGLTRIATLGQGGARCMTLNLASIPPGSIVRHFNGRLLVASGSMLYISEPYYYGLFNPAKGYIPFPAPITVLECTTEGFFVCSDKTYSMADIDGPPVVVLPYGGIAGTGGQSPEEDQVFWASPRGVIMAKGATVNNLQEKTLALKGGKSGATLYREQDGAKHIIASRSAPGVTGAAARTFMDAEVVRRDMAGRYPVAHRRRPGGVTTPPPTVSYLTGIMALGGFTGDGSLRGVHSLAGAFTVPPFTTAGTVFSLRSMTGTPSIGPITTLGAVSTSDHVLSGAITMAGLQISGAMKTIGGVSGSQTLALFTAAGALKAVESMSGAIALPPFPVTGAMQRLTTLSLDGTAILGAFTTSGSISSSVYSTPALLKFNGNTTNDNSSGPVFSLVGSGVINPTDVEYGSGALDVGGGTGGAASATAVSLAGKFAIEVSCFVYSSFGGFAFSVGDDTLDGNAISVRLAAGQVRLHVHASGADTWVADSGATLYPNRTYFKLGLFRNAANLLTCTINGAVVFTYSLSGTVAGKITVGGRYNNGTFGESVFGGVYDNFRLTDGTDRYTSFPYTPATGEWALDTGGSGGGNIGLIGSPTLGAFTTTGGIATGSSGTAASRNHFIAGATRLTSGAVQTTLDATQNVRLNGAGPFNGFRLRAGQKVVGIPNVTKVSGPIIIEAGASASLLRGVDADGGIVFETGDALTQNMQIEMTRGSITGTGFNLKNVDAISAVGQHDLQDARMENCSFCRVQTQGAGISPANPAFRCVGRSRALMKKNVLVSTNALQAYRADLWLDTATDWTLIGLDGEAYLDRTVGPAIYLNNIQDVRVMASGGAAGNVDGISANNIDNFWLMVQGQAPGPSSKALVMTGVTRAILLASSDASKTDNGGTSRIVQNGDLSLTLTGTGHAAQLGTGAPWLGWTRVSRVKPAAYTPPGGMTDETAAIQALLDANQIVELEDRPYKVGTLYIKPDQVLMGGPNTILVGTAGLTVLSLRFLNSGGIPTTGGFDLLDVRVHGGDTGLLQGETNVQVNSMCVSGVVFSDQTLAGFYVHNTYAVDNCFWNRVTFDNSNTSGKSMLQRGTDPDGSGQGPQISYIDKLTQNECQYFKAPMDLQTTRQSNLNVWRRCYMEDCAHRIANGYAYTCIVGTTWLRSSLDSEAQQLFIVDCDSTKDGGYVFGPGSIMEGCAFAGTSQPISPVPGNTFWNGFRMNAIAINCSGSVGLNYMNRAVGLDGISMLSIKSTWPDSAWNASVYNRVLDTKGTPYLGDDTLSGGVVVA